MYVFVCVWWLLSLCMYVCVCVWFQWLVTCRCCFTSWRCWSVLGLCHCRRPHTALSSTSFIRSVPVHSSPSAVSQSLYSSFVWVVWWRTGQGIGLAINRSWVQILVTLLPGKLALCGWLGGLGPAFISICCTVVVQYVVHRAVQRAVQQTHNKSKAHCKSTSNYTRSPEHSRSLLEIHVKLYSMMSSKSTVNYSGGVWFQWLGHSTCNQQVLNCLFVY